MKYIDILINEYLSKEVSFFSGTFCDLLSKYFELDVQDFITHCILISPKIMFMFMAIFRLTNRISEQVIFVS